MPYNKFFEAHRKSIFATTPQQQGLSLPADKNTVYGLVIDWERGGHIATSVFFLTGGHYSLLSTSEKIFKHPK